jgi:hypothetical protein
MQPGEGGRQGVGRQLRRTGAEARTSRTDAYLQSTPQSQAPMSGTALDFAQQRKSSDKVFAVEAEELRDKSDAQARALATDAPVSGILSDRGKLLDAIILSAALGQPVCRRRNRVNRKPGYTNPI